MFGLNGEQIIPFEKESHHENPYDRLHIEGLVMEAVVFGVQNPQAGEVPEEIVEALGWQWERTRNAIEIYAKSAENRNETGRLIGKIEAVK